MIGHMKFATVLFEVYRQILPNLPAGESDLHPVTVCDVFSGASLSDCLHSRSTSTEQDATTTGSGALQSQLPARHVERRQRDQRNKMFSTVLATNVQRNAGH